MNSFSFFRWLNLLSLDVVLIALAWQEVFARAAFVTLRWEERTFLAISIWIVYILDHWLDSMADAVSSAGFFSNKAPRHHYVRSHRFVLGSLLVLASLANVWLLWHLGLRLLIAGMGLVVITLSYLVINTFFLRRGRWFKGREIIISIIFSVGCSLVGLVQGDRPWLLLPWIMAFALVALINCTLIARMERIDFFRNSTSDANCGVAPVLASSSINYTLSRCAPEAPGTSSPEASLERNLVLPLAPKIFFSPRSVLCLLLFLVLFAFPFSSIIKAFSWSLMGLALIPMIGRRWGYEVASLAADQVLFFGALLSLLI